MPRVCEPHDITLKSLKPLKITTIPSLPYYIHPPLARWSTLTIEKESYVLHYTRAYRVAHCLFSKYEALSGNTRPRNLFPCNQIYLDLIGSLTASSQSIRHSLSNTKPGNLSFQFNLGLTGSLTTSSQNIRHSLSNTKPRNPFPFNQILFIKGVEIATAKSRFHIIGSKQSRVIEAEQSSRSRVE